MQTHETKGVLDENEHIRKGVILDDERLKQGKAVFGKDYFREYHNKLEKYFCTFTPKMSVL